jgi:hypothetical protein
VISQIGQEMLANLNWTPTLQTVLAQVRRSSRDVAEICLYQRNGLFSREAPGKSGAGLKRPENLGGLGPGGSAAATSPTVQLSALQPTGAGQALGVRWA